MAMNTIVRLPAFRTPFTGKSSRTEKPSGIAYILLSIMSSDESRYQTWGDALRPMGIPDDMFGMFAGEVAPMRRNGMVDADVIPDIDDSVSRTRITPMGLEAFQRGVVAVDTTVIAGNVVYCPARGEGNKYLVPEAAPPTKSPDETAGRFQDIVPDTDSMDDLVVSKRDKFGIRTDEDVFDLEFGVPEMRMYDETLNLDFDGARGCFSVVNSTKLDTRFIKQWYTADQLIPAAWGTVAGKITVKSWDAEVPEDWTAVEYILPYAFKLNVGTVLVNPDFCDIDGAMGYDGAGAVVLISSEIGYEYMFVRREMTVGGIDGSVTMNCVVRRTLDKARIAETVEGILGKQKPGTTEEVGRLARLAFMIGSERATDLVAEYLTRAINLGVAVRAIGDSFRMETWHSVMPQAIERAMCGRTGKLKQDVESLISINATIDGRELAAAMSGRDAKLEDIDLLCKIANSKAAVISTVNAGSMMVASISEGRSGEGRSAPFQKMYNAGKLLAGMKQTMSVRTLSDYSFDLSEIGSEALKQLKTDAGTYTKDISELEKYLNAVNGFDELRQYGRMFADLATAAPSSAKLEYMQGRAFGIELGVRTEAALEEMGCAGDLKTKIESALEAGLISKDAHSTLESIRLFRNQCAHSMDIPPVDKKTRSAWINAVKSLKLPEPEPEKTEGSAKAETAGSKK